MPTSDNITVPTVSEIINIVSPESALDIGVGTGKFGFVFREECDWRSGYNMGLTNIGVDRWRTKLDGIEVCPDYITTLHEYLYNEVHIGLAQDVIPGLGSYDLIYMGDVIEHFNKPEAMALLETLYNKVKMGILIVTPVGEYCQSGTETNPYQEHKSVWSPKDIKRFPWRLSLKIKGRQWVMFISKSKELLYTIKQERKIRTWDGYFRRYYRYKKFLSRIKNIVSTSHS